MEPLTLSGMVNPTWHRYLLGVAGAVPADSFVFVDSPSDLPAPISGAIQLRDNVTYFFTTTVDLKGSRLVGGRNTTILGGSSENCRIKSTGLTGTALISSEWSLPVRGITFEADIALNLDASANANQALDWFGVNFTDCATVGTIKGYANCIIADSALLNSQGLTFDGEIGTVGISQCLFDCSDAGTAIIIPATANITRRFRIIYSSFVALSGETALNVSTSATILVEGYILDNCNFSGGGTYTTGVTFSDNKARWDNNRGVQNSASIGFMYMQNNAVATVVASSGVAYKAAGATTGDPITQRFTHASNRLTYNGALTRDFRILVSTTIISGANNEIGLYIAKNGSTIANSEQYITANPGGRAEGGSCQTVVSLTTNDYVEFFVENDTAATNITVEFMSMIAEAPN
jgi:hypothetical protein